MENKGFWELWTYINTWGLNVSIRIAIVATVMTLYIITLTLSLVDFTTLNHMIAREYKTYCLPWRRDPNFLPAYVCIHGHDFLTLVMFDTIYLRKLQVVYSHYPTHQFQQWEKKTKDQSGFCRQFCTCTYAVKLKLIKMVSQYQ